MESVSRPGTSGGGGHPKANHIVKRWARTAERVRIANGLPRTAASTEEEANAFKQPKGARFVSIIRAGARNAAFGELGLISNETRSATIQTEEKSGQSVFCVTRRMCACMCGLSCGHLCGTHRVFDTKQRSI